MQRVELIGASAFFEPMPLRDRRFEQRGRGVGVVFKEFRWLVPVIGKIKAAIERRRIRAPGRLDQGHLRRCDTEFRAATFFDHMFDRGQREAMQLFRSGFDFIDLRGAELITRRFIPIAAIIGVKRKAQRLEFLPPVRARRAGQTLHAQLPLDW